MKLKNPTRGSVTSFDAVSRSGATSAWHHAAATVESGRDVTVYFNGQAVGTGTPDNTAAANFGLRLGRDTEGNAFDGVLD